MSARGRRAARTTPSRATRYTARRRRRPAERRQWPSLRVSVCHYNRWMTSHDETWPEFSCAAWPDTYATLHMWTQIVGKIKLKLSPQVNHWWGAALQLCARGLTTLTMPHSAGAFEMTFDFCAHELQIRMNDTRMKVVKLESKSVADFYAQTMAALTDLGVAVKIWTMPVEIPNPIRFTEDRGHASYDAAA